MAPSSLLRTRSVEQHSVLVNGRMMSGKQLKDYTTKNGLCPICAETKVKQKKRKGLKNYFEPITVEDHRHPGEFLVYKGYCLGALCYSLEQAMRELGEISKDASKAEVSRHMKRIKKSLERNHQSDSFTDYNGEEVLSAEVTFADPRLAAAASVAASATTDLNSIQSGEIYANQAIPSHPSMSVSSDHDSMGGSTISSHERSRKSAHSKFHQSFSDGSSYDHRSNYNRQTYPGGGSDAGSYDNGSDYRSSCPSSYSGRSRPSKKKSTVEDLIFVPPKSSSSAHAGSTRNITQSNITMDSFLDTQPIQEESQTVTDNNSRRSLPFVPKSQPSQYSGTDRYRPVREDSTPGMTATTGSSAMSENDFPREYENRNQSCEVEYEVQGSVLNSSQNDFTSRTDTITDEQVRSSSITTEMVHEESLALFEVEEFARKGDFQALVTESLHTHYTNPNITYRSFQLLRSSLHRLQGHVFESSEWVKICTSAMKRHSNNHRIQAEGLLMLWSIVSIDPRYMKDVTKGSCVTDILDFMDSPMPEPDNGFNDISDEDPTLAHYACGFIECLTRDDEHGLNVRHPSINHVLDALVSIVSDSGISVWGQNKTTINGLDAKVLSLRALYNLSHRDGLGERVCHSMSKSNGFNSLVFVIKSEKIYPDAVEWAIRLLWRLTSAEFSPLPPDAISIIASVDLADAVFSTINNFDDVAVHSAVCGLLSKMSNGPITSITDAILLSARTHHDNLEIQVQCVNLLNSLCSNEEKCKVVAHMDVTDVVVNAMNNFVEHAEIQSAASMALAYIASNDEQSRMLVASNRGAYALVNAFHNFGVDDDSSYGSADTRAMVIDSSCSALAALSISSQAAKDIKESGMLFELEKYLCKHKGQKMSSCMITIVINILALSVQLDVQGDRNADRAVDLLLNALEHVSIAEEANTLMGSLALLHAKSPQILDSIITYNGGRGIHHVLRVLEAFADSAPVQKAGCLILSNVYVRIPYNGSLNQISEVTKGDSSFKVTSHTIREANVLLSTLDKYKNEERIILYACDALSNFIAGSSDLLVSYEVGEPDEVVHTFSGCIKKVFDVMSIFEESLEIQRSASRLLLVLLFLHDDLELKRWSSLLIGRIREAMIRFRNDDELYLNACGILATLVEDEETAKVIVEDNGIKLLISCLRLKNKNIVERSSRTLATILRNDYAANNDFMEVDDSVPTVVLCMVDNSDSPDILINCCSLLETVACLHEHYVKALIANNGGLNACLSAIRRHGNNEAVAEAACLFLSAVIDGVNPNVISKMKSEILELLTAVLRDHRDNAEVMQGLFAGMWGICAIDDDFKGCLADAGAIPLIIDAMSKHLRHEPCQERGCSLLWMLSSYGQNKQYIGMDGANCVINAMMYHITSMALQKEGLIALKNLATLSELKAAIRSIGGVDAIVSSMWMNMSSDIICAAISALNNIAVDREKKSVAQMDNGELDVILFAMRRFQDDAEVQKCSCFLLKTYVFERSNRVLLHERGDEVVALLTIAADRYPSDCGSRASHVIGVLYA